MKHFFEIKMTYKKSTKGTHVYQSDTETPVPTIYIRRYGLPTPAPEEILLRVEVPDEK